MHFRVFAETDGGATSLAALEYVRALVRIAPVRLVTVTGQLLGPWRVFERLVVTPQETPIRANIVCTDRLHWARRIKVPMHKSDPLAQVLATGDAAAPVAETITSVVELYTEGLHNVLIALQAPSSEDQRNTTARYETVIVPSQALAQTFAREGRTPFVLPPNLVTQLAMRSALRIPYQ